MKPLPLEDIRLNLASHRSVLWWVGLLYRAPRRVEAAGERLSRAQSAVLVGRFYLHLVPYLFVLGAVGRWVAFGVLELDPSPELAETLETHGPLLGHFLGLLQDLTFSLTFSLVFGLAFGLVVGLVGGLAEALAVGLVFVLAIGFAVGLSVGLTEGPVFGLTVVLAFVAVGVFAILLAILLAGVLAVGFPAGLAGVLSVSLSVGLAVVLAFVLAGGLAGTVDVGVGVGVGWSLGYVLVFLRLFYLPVHLFLVWPRARPQSYGQHPVAWDNGCLLTFPGLDRLLVAYAEHAPEDGSEEIERLIDTYPSQRSAALRAKAVLIARGAARVRDLARLDSVFADLPEGREGFLAQTPEVRRRVHEIVAVEARLGTLKRPFLREPYAALVVEKIESFRHRIAGFDPPLSTELRAAAGEWLKIARRQLDEARAAMGREPLGQVFRAGDPVDRDREAFLYRDSIFGELERQVLLAGGCPGLLIYGRRRMGKSTLLQNLEGFIPPELRVARLSMQQAGAFASLESLLGLLAERVRGQLPELRGGGDDESPTDLQAFEAFLNRVQDHLKEDGRRMLMAIDEYENLDVKIGEGVLPVDLLAVVRESIQRHRRIIWAFAGSHAITELQHAPWTSYLVSARTLEVPPFEEEETRLLLTEPLKHSTLWRDLDAKKPSFQPGFWGPGGIETVHRQTGGWPHLVQLVAEAVVDLVNDAGGESADAELLERALDKAVVRGENVFIELLERESKLPGEWDYLRAFRTADSQPRPEDEDIARSLRRRLLITEEGDSYRLRVPLMGRWMRQRL